MFGFARCIGLFLLVLSGCTSGQGNTILRPAMDQPIQFMIDSTSGRISPKAGDGCRNPLVDPRDGTRLTLIRSAGGSGDYAVSAGRYGVHEGELLRIDCSTGRAIGIVKR